MQWVIGKNLHRRHLTGLQRASCVSAALNWATQGQQQAMHTERGDGGQFSPIPAESAGIGATAPQTDSGQDEQGAFFTQDERAALADVSERTQQESDRYEKAGLGPEVRSGAISGAEAERKVRDPDAPKPPSRVQQLEMQVEAQALTIDSLEREVREAKSQVSEYPHEREVIISAQTSSIAELQTKLNDEEAPCIPFPEEMHISRSGSAGGIALRRPQGPQPLAQQAGLAGRDTSAPAGPPLSGRSPATG